MLSLPKDILHTIMGQTGAKVQLNTVCKDLRRDLNLNDIDPIILADFVLTTFESSDTTSEQINKAFKVIVGIKNVEAFKVILKFAVGVKWQRIDKVHAMGVKVENYMAMKAAVEGDNIEMAEIILRIDDDISRLIEIVFEVVKKPSVKMCKFLFDQPGAPRVTWQMLEAIAYYCNTDVLEFLLNQPGAPPANFWRGMLLKIAAENNKTEMVEMLLKRTRRARHDIESLDFAATYGHYEVAKILLKHGVPASQSHNNRPLCSAALFGHIAIVQLLLDHGAKPSNKSLRDASYSAIFPKGHPEIVKKLKKNKISYQYINNARKENLSMESDQ